MTYAERLRDPRWLAKRDQIVSAREYRCQDCNAEKGDFRERLHVHHTTYARGMEPWEYPDDTLLCLCSECHEQRQIEEDEARFEFGRVLARLAPEEVYCVTKRLRAAANSVDFQNPDWTRPKLFCAVRALAETLQRRFCR